MCHFVLAGSLPAPSDSSGSAASPVHRWQSHRRGVRQGLQAVLLGYNLAFFSFCGVQTTKMNVPCSVCRGHCSFNDACTSLFHPFFSNISNNFFLYPSVNQFPFSLPLSSSFLPSIFPFLSLHISLSLFLHLCLSPLRDVFLTDGSRVSAATVASTAIAAAQWAVSQVSSL